VDEALRVLQDEVIPAFEKLGDVRSLAVMQGKIADILEARGQLDEALRIRQKEELPVYERLGDVRGLIVGRANLAMTLIKRGQDGDLAIAIGHLRWAAAAAHQHGFAEAAQLDGLLSQFSSGTH
jgi:hypothetical protein